jgi:hypothetical protein
MAETRKGRIKLLDRPFREGHVDAYIEGDTRPLWKGFRASLDYSTPNKRGGFRRVGLTYHSDDDSIGGAVEWRFKKGGLARNIDGKAIQGRTNPKYF